MDNKQILVVVDCQNDFIDGSLANSDAQAVVPNIVNKIHSRQWDVIYVTRDTHTKNYLDSKEGQKLPIKHCIEFSEGWQINPNVQAALVDAENNGVLVKYIDKPTFGSFTLVADIQTKAFYSYANPTIEFVGFCTDICVVSNALMTKAVAYNAAEVSCDASCCAGTTVENHIAALKVMRSCQINIMNYDFGE